MKNFSKIVSQKYFQLIILGLFILALMITYTLVDSKIDEQKQKTILLEKQRLVDIEKKPLENCLASVEQGLDNQKQIFLAWATAEIKRCEATPSQCKRSIEAIRQDLFSSDDVADKESEIKKDECYKHYK